MKLFYFFLLTIAFSSTIYSTEIAIFKLSYVIDKSLEFLILVRHPFLVNFIGTLTPEMSDAITSFPKFIASN